MTKKRLIVWISILVALLAFAGINELLMRYPIQGIHKKVSDSPLPDSTPSETKDDGLFAEFSLDNYSDDIVASLNCDRDDLTNADRHICLSEIRGLYYMVLDNFFASYYRAIIANSPETSQEAIQKIAIDALKLRSDMGDKGYEFAIKLLDDDDKAFKQCLKRSKICQANNLGLYDEDKQECDSCFEGFYDEVLLDENLGYAVGFGYEKALRDLSLYVLEHNPELFAKIFPKNTESYKALLTAYTQTFKCSYSCFMDKKQSKASKKENLTGLDWWSYGLFRQLRLDELIDTHGALRIAETLTHIPLEPIYPKGTINLTDEGYNEGYDEGYDEHSQEPPVSPKGLHYYPQSREELLELVKYENIYLNNIDTSAITDMSNLFENSNRSNFSGIESWDTSNVVSMKKMFSSAYEFNGDISKWDTSNVRDMSEMFSNAYKFNGDISKWNVSNVVNMNLMFVFAESFNQPLNDWNVSNVKEMGGMFDGAIKFNQPLDKWDVSNVEDMGAMFYGAKAFNQDLNMWQNSPDLRFDTCDCFPDYFVKGSPLALDPPKWVLRVQGYYEDMSDEGIAQRTEIAFQNGKFHPKDRNELIALLKFQNLKLDRIDTSAVTDMRALFAEVGFRRDFSGIGSWDTSNVEDMSQMFDGVIHFNEDISKWNVNNVKYMSEMFDGAIAFNQDISAWDISNVSSMRLMLDGAIAFNQNLESWGARLRKDADTTSMFDNSPLKANPPSWYRK